MRTDKKKDLGVPVCPVCPGKLQNLGADSSGSWKIRCKGDAMRAVNLRPDEDGGMTSCGKPGVVASVEGVPVLCDQRGEITTVITADESGTLRHEASLYRGDAVEKLPAVSLETTGNVAQGVACGEFLVIRNDDGLLSFLIWNHDLRRYTPLGSHPALPALNVSVAEKTVVRSTIRGATLKTPVSDPRTGLEATFLREVEANAKEAVCSLDTAMRAAGLICGTVYVRALYRLWDGSVLAVTPPVAAAGTSPHSLPRTRMELTTASGSMTGVAATELSLECHRLRVDLTGELPEGWSEVVRSVEIYVATEPGLCAGNPTAAYVTATQNGSTAAINVSFPRYSDDDYMELMEAGEYRLAASIPVTQPLSATVGSTGSRILDASLLEQPDLRVRLSGPMCGHGSFLHTTTGRNYSKVQTSLRGNPLTAHETATDAGAPVRAMAAQPVGGGAYTRQYVYLFTDAGIVALTHDMYGNHTNMRSISPALLTDSRRTVTTSGGVWALTDEGELLRLRDASAESVMRGLTDFSQLLWDSRFNELLLIPDPRSGLKEYAALHLDGGIRGLSLSTRTPVPPTVLNAAPLPLSWHREGDGHQISLLDDGSQSAAWLWQTTPIPTPGGGTYLAESYHYGTDGEAHISMRRRNGTVIVSRSGFCASGIPFAIATVLPVMRDHTAEVIIRTGSTGGQLAGVSLRRVSR